MSLLSFSVLLLEQLQSLGYTMVNIRELHPITCEYWTMIVCKWLVSLHKSVISVAVLMLQLHVHYFVHPHGSCAKLEISVLLPDAFMDFTSGILSVTGINATGHIFASYPARHLSVLGGFIDQVSSGHSDPMTSTTTTGSLSDSKCCKVWQMQLMQHWLPQLVWEHPIICSFLGLMTHFLAFTQRPNL